MSVQTQIDRINTAKMDIATAISNKGVTVPTGTKIDSLAPFIDSIEAGAADPVLQSKTVSPTTSSQTVKPDSGYDGLSQVTVNAMPTATQATPSITVSSTGLITAKSTQSAGYVVSGTKQATKQLTTQAAKTVTPTTSNQTAVASGRYTTGVITVKGDANLVAGNIKSGVSIFGVAGNYEGSSSGGGGAEIESITVRLSIMDIFMASFRAQIICSVVDSNGNISQSIGDTYSGNYDVHIYNVIKGSVVTVITDDPMEYVTIRGDGELVATNSNGTTWCVRAIEIFPDSGDLTIAPSDI